MKKLYYLLLIGLVSLSLISCQQTTKKSSKATDDDDSDSDSTTTSSSSSSDSMTLTVTSGNGSCSGTTCTINKKGASYIIKVSYSGLDSSDTYLSMLTSYDDNMKLTNTSSSSYVNIVGKSSSSKGGSQSATLLTRNVTKCKESNSDSKCSPSLTDGKKSSPSAKSSSWDTTTNITIETDTDATDPDDEDESETALIIDIIKEFDPDGSLTPYLDLIKLFAK